MIRFVSIALIFAASAVLVGCNSSSDQPRPVTAKAVVHEGSLVFTSYGEPVNAFGPETPVGTVLGDLKSYEGKPIRVAGTVSKVCTTKGCWLEMSDAGDELFVKFTCPIEGRLIPAEAVGKKAIVEGELAIKEISEADARHLAEEGGKPAAEIARIVGPQKQVTLKSPGAIVFGVTK